MQQVADLFGIGAFARGHQFVFARHHLGDLHVHARLEAHVATGDDAYQLASGNNRHARDVVLAGQLEQFAHRAIRSDGDRIANDAAFELLHRAHFPRLLFDRHVLVDDTDAAFLRHCNGKARFRYGVHGRGHQRDVQRDRSSEAGLEIDFGRQDVGQGRQQQNVVEGECVVCYPQHGRGLLCEIKRAILLVDQWPVNDFRASSRPTART